VAALRAYLTARTGDGSKDAERGFLTLSQTDHLDGIGDLVYGAFAAAARRRFAPVWTPADIVRFVAGFRGSSAQAARRLADRLIAVSAGVRVRRLPRIRCGSHDGQGVTTWRKGEMQARPARSGTGAMFRGWSTG